MHNGDRGVTERNRSRTKKDAQSAEKIDESAPLLPISDEDRKAELKRIDDICANITSRVQRLDREQAELWKSLSSKESFGPTETKRFSDKPRNHLLRSLDKLEATRRSLLVGNGDDSGEGDWRTEAENIPVKEHISLVNNGAYCIICG